MIAVMRQRRKQFFVDAPTARRLQTGGLRSFRCHVHAGHPGVASLPHPRESAPWVCGQSAVYPRAEWDFVATYRSSPRGRVRSIARRVHVGQSSVNSQCCDGESSTTRGARGDGRQGFRKPRSELPVQLLQSAGRCSDAVGSYPWRIGRLDEFSECQPVRSIQTVQRVAAMRHVA